MQFILGTPHPPATNTGPAMSRFESEYPLFHLTPSDNSSTHYSDHAQEIAASIEYKQCCYATEVVFDDEGDLVYGQDIPFLTYALDLPLTSTSGENYSTRQQIVEISDSSYEDASVLYSGFPFSVTSRGLAVLKPTCHKTHDDGPWRQALDTAGLDGLLACMKGATHDLWNTSGKELTARFLQPLPTPNTVFSGKQASLKQFQEAFQEVQQQHSDSVAALATPGSQVSQFLRPASITLWGLCKDYDKACVWLMTHKDVTKLLNQTEEGTLFWDNPLKQVNGQPPRVATEVSDLMLEVLDAAIHYVLSGTFHANAWRGTVTSRRSPGTTYKQTVATHLCAVYLDMMRNLQKRVTHVPKKRDRTTRLDVVPPNTEGSLSTTHFEAEFRDSVTEYSDRMQESDGPLVDPETTIAAALRSADPSVLKTAMALAVAAHKSNELCDASQKTILRLLMELQAHDQADVAGFARLAHQAMHE